MSEENLSKRAKLRALHLLERMDRTEAQLREKLKQNEYPKEIIDEAIEYVKQYDYVDDLRYACSYVRYRSHNKSRYQLAMELYRKGVAQDLVEQALESEYVDEDDTEKILRLAEKRHYDARLADVKEKQRMYRYLMRKGFSSDDILRALDIAGQ